MTNTPVEGIKAILSLTATRWLGLTSTVSADLLTRTPAPNEWSAMDCLNHLLDAEQMVFPVRLRAFMAGQPIVAFDPDSEGTKDSSLTPEQMASEFARLRKASLVELERVTAQDLARSTHHSELGLITLGQLLHEWAAHDLMHTVQAERALMQPFIRECGPWRPYFQDHDVGNK